MTFGAQSVVHSCISSELPSIVQMNKTAAAMCQWEPWKAALQRDTASVFPDLKVGHNHDISFQKKIKESRREPAHCRKSSSPEVYKNRCSYLFFLHLNHVQKTQHTLPSMGTPQCTILYVMKEIECSRCCHIYCMQSLTNRVREWLVLTMFV